MNLRSYFQFTVPVVLSALALVSACGGNETVDQSVDSAKSAVSVSPNHVMRMTPPGPVGQAAIINKVSGAHLNYYGGPVLSNVQVIPVYWNSGVAYRTSLDGFYSAVPSRSTIYTSLLGQYGSGPGSRVTSYIDNKSGGTYSDAQVQSELTNLFNLGRIPRPNSNTYYPVHFPAGTTVLDSGGSASCTVWCAYHGTFTYGGVNVNYGIIPDQGGGCAGGCGGNPSRFNNLTSVSSHELVEATNDPAVGLATVYGPPLAWYDPNYGEIGDICNASQASSAGYVVQTEWSNRANACTIN